MKLEDPRFVKSLVEVSHIEFQSYDFYHRHLICSSGTAEKILGYSKEEYFELSKDYYKGIVHPDDWRLMEENVSNVMHSAPGEVVELTIRIKRSQGDYLWIYSRKIVSERNAVGEPVTITSIIEDVNDIITLREDLSAKVDQLRKISYINSHLVRVPVANIIGLIHLIEEKHITSQHNLEVFYLLREAIEKLDELIHEVSDLTHRPAQ